MDTELYGGLSGYLFFASSGQSKQTFEPQTFLLAKIENIADFTMRQVDVVITNIVPLVLNRQFFLTDIGNPHLLKFNA